MCSSITTIYRHGLRRSTCYGRTTEACIGTISIISIIIIYDNDVSIISSQGLTLSSTDRDRLFTREIIKVTSYTTLCITDESTTILTGALQGRTKSSQETAITTI